MIFMVPPRSSHTSPAPDSSVPLTSWELRGRAVEVRPLEWETNFFGARMGALVAVGGDAGAGVLGTLERGSLSAQADALAHELRGALREAELDGYRHLTFRVAAEDLPAIWAAGRAGLRLMDVALDLGYDFRQTPVQSPHAEDRVLRVGVTADIPALHAMTTGAFTLTRFGVDPFFTQSQVDSFYATWATNLFSGLADVVLVAEVEGRLAGFVSCKLNHSCEGRIPLVATSTEFQRRGIARDLVAAALAWFGDAGCRVAYVKTQAANYPAVTLYERAGFTVRQSELTFTTTLN
jgi:ribosomal protein S18 acetylase RimI-like enzyme